MRAAFGSNLVLVVGVAWFGVCMACCKGGMFEECTQKMLLGGLGDLGGTLGTNGATLPPTGR